MLPLLLGALKFAPAVLSAGMEIFNAVTGEELPPDTTPETLHDKIEQLPPEQRAVIAAEIVRAKTRAQELDTARFAAMNDGGAEKVRATARPEIALQAMGVIRVFATAFKVLVLATVLEWLARAGFAVAGEPFPVTESLWDLIADAAPVAEMIWGPLIASFWVCAEVIKKYMGCRERDKAQQYEMQAGKPLTSAAATIEAAGGGIAGIIKAVRGK